MAVLVLNQSRQSEQRSSSPASGHPTMYLADDTGLKLELPYAPRTVERGGLSASWQSVDRAGRKPLLLKDGPQLDALSFDVLILGDPTDHQASAEGILAQLRELAERAGRVTVGNMGPSERGTWRLVGAQQRSELRAHGTNLITRATVSLSFLEASDVVVAVGPVTGGAKPPPAVKRKTTAAGKPGGAARAHTFRSGDTLTAIAVRLYGDGSKWRRIADANGIRDPRKLKVGTVLKVPA